MPPDDASLSSLGHYRLRLLPELAAASRRIAQLREERDELTRQATCLDAQVRDLQHFMEQGRARLMTRGPIGGAALAGLDAHRRRLCARRDELTDRRARLLDRCRGLEVELRERVAGLLRARARLDVVGEMIEEKRAVRSAREADARLEELVDDCAHARPQRRMK